MKRKNRGLRDVLVSAKALSASIALVAAALSPTPEARPETPERESGFHEALLA